MAEVCLDLQPSGHWFGGGHFMRQLWPLDAASWETGPFYPFDNGPNGLNTLVSPQWMTRWVQTGWCGGLGGVEDVCVVMQWLARVNAPTLHTPSCIHHRVYTMITPLQHHCNSRGLLVMADPDTPYLHVGMNSPAPHTFNNLARAWGVGVQNMTREYLPLTAHGAGGHLQEDAVGDRHSGDGVLRLQARRDYQCHVMKHPLSDWKPEHLQTGGWYHTYIIEGIAMQ